MAKAAFNLPFNHPFSTSLGNYSVFTRRDSDKLIIRSKGGAKADKIHNDPNFKRTRDQMSEFSGCSTASKMVREAMATVKGLSNISLHGQIVKIVSKIRAFDSNPIGERSIIFSRGKHLLEGFSLNRNTTLDSMISSPIAFSIQRREYTAVVQIPALSPGINFNSPYTYPYFRFKVNLGIIRDLVYEPKKGYKPLLQDAMEYTATLDTEWMQSKKDQVGQEVGLHIDDPVFDESCNLLLSIGVEFGIAEDGKINPVKHAGCGKILGMG